MKIIILLKNTVAANKRNFVLMLVKLQRPFILKAHLQISLPTLSEFEQLIKPYFAWDQKINLKALQKISLFVFSRILTATLEANLSLTYLKPNRGTTRCKICLKLTIKIPERRQWRRSSIFIVNFEHISHLVLVILLLALNK